MESSRIFVRGLPPNISEDQFKQHFSKYPTTDAKVFPHRRIGYIGYQSPEDAAKAVKYFNKSFIRMSRIWVELARAVSDEKLPKSRREQHKERSAPSINTDYIPPQPSLKRKRDGDEDEEADPKLKEFLEVMQPPSKSKSWKHDSAAVPTEAPGAPEAAVEVSVPENESDDEYQVVGKKPKTSSQHVAQEPQKPLPAPAPGKTISSDLPDAPEDTIDTTYTINQDAGPVSDVDWLRSRTSRVLDLQDDNEEEEEDEQAVAEPTNQDMNGAQGAQGQDEAASPIDTGTTQVDMDPPQEDTAEDAIRKTGRLFLRNLPYGVTADDLRSHFSSFGSLEEVHVSMNSKTGTGKGFAYLLYSDPEHAVAAFSANDGTVFQGRLLHIIPGMGKRQSGLDDFSISKLPLKKQREVRRKAEASSSTFNWNSLYLNADAVMSSMANRLGISKAEILDPTSSAAAVKQAHAETHIISETKAYFASHGVDLEAFKRSAKGDTAILVKNIPSSTSPEEIQRLFEEHGTITHFLMPPSGLTAIVDFANAAQAKSAFTSLAYRKIKDSILFLEKAPRDLFIEGVKAPVVIKDTVTLDEKNRVKLSATDLLEDTPASEEVDSAPVSTLFVNNLNFTTTSEKLKEIFSPLDGFQSAKVKTKVDPKRGVLSMGFGFLEFRSVSAAQAALRAMHGYMLEGHRLALRFSHKGADAAEERRREDAAKKAASAKIIIKNLPFEASKKDVRALFAPYGQLRSVRVPSKFDGKSRGFGFCEFTTKREASNAMAALRNTHLLGRRLVLEFAEAGAADPEKELEKMQEKVGSQVNKVALQRLTGGGRKKFNVTGNDDLEES